MSGKYDIEENFVFNQTEEKLHLVVKVTFISLETIIALISIFINSIIIMAFIKEPKLRRKINLYIISLVTVDFISGLLIIPFGIIRPIFGVPYGVSWCLGNLVLRLSFNNISILSLVILSYRRYKILSSNQPLNSTLPTKTVIRDIIFVWIGGITLSYDPYKSYDNIEKCVIGRILSKPFIMFRFVIMVLMPIIILGFNYFKIHKIILNRIDIERKLKFTACDITNQQKNEKLLKREMKITRNFSLILIIFMITWIPVHITYIARLLGEIFVVHRNVIALAINFSHLGSAINPFLYAYRMEDIRKAIRKHLNIQKKNFNLDDNNQESSEQVDNKLGKMST